MMTILPAVEADISTLVPLVNAAYRGEGGWTGEAHLIAGNRTDETGIAELMNQPHAVILVYKDETGETTGCVYLQKQGHTLYLGLLSVRPDQQAKGIGKKLLAAADRYAVEQGCQRISITVISARTELLVWYERHGYTRTGESQPFHAGEKFGIQKEPLELLVLEKSV